MKDNGLYEIKDILCSVVKETHDKQSDYDIIKNIVFSNLDEKYKSYIKISDISDGILWLNINNSIIFSEIICFQKKKINDIIICLLNKHGIREIRYRLGI